MARIVLEVPDTCKSLLAEIPDVVARLAGIAADAAASEDVDYVAVERDVAAQCARLERAAHLDTLAAMERERSQLAERVGLVKVGIRQPHRAKHRAFGLHLDTGAFSGLWHTEKFRWRSPEHGAAMV